MTNVYHNDGYLKYDGTLQAGALGPIIPALDPAQSLSNGQFTRRSGGSGGGYGEDAGAGQFNTFLAESGFFDFGTAQNVTNATAYFSSINGGQGYFIASNSLTPPYTAIQPFTFPAGTMAVQSQVYAGGAGPFRYFGVYIYCRFEAYLVQLTLDAAPAQIPYRAKADTYLLRRKQCCMRTPIEPVYVRKDVSGLTGPFAYCLDRGQVGNVPYIRIVPAVFNFNGAYHNYDTTMRILRGNNGLQDGQFTPNFNSTAARYYSQIADAPLDFIWNSSIQFVVEIVPLAEPMPANSTVEFTILPYYID